MGPVEGLANCHARETSFRCHCDGDMLRGLGSCCVGTALFSHDPVPRADLWIVVRRDPPANLGSDQRVLLFPPRVSLVLVAVLRYHHVDCTLAGSLVTCVQFARRTQALEAESERSSQVVGLLILCRDRVTVRRRGEGEVGVIDCRGGGGGPEQEANTQRTLGP